ncbi:HNH endonuclease family protein [Aureispira anguillae]|uniref:HNH nuclease domain-containing protein n=1 Tax=Aureispira anguillae TaxID=2864201 RepID=A0A915YIT3_9BACT|nr:hypothetical protein [Aureispira anguillae]BDS13777.1 hypothetical protein AsAng_0045390 [Aureispira anguillae]
MIQTNSIPIRKGILNHLKKLQDQIDALPTYKEQVKQAKVLWQNKKKTNAQKAAFNRVEKELQKIAIGTSNCCNYCESNLGTTIEHIYPRGLYPNKTFVWENFLWTCKTCNGKHKISQFQIFETPLSSNTINLVKDYTFTPPPNADAVFINPRTENPLHYLQLDLNSGLFSPTHSDPASRAYKRAVYTLETLQLNTRKALVIKRKEAYQKYLQLIQDYALIQEATSLDELVCFQSYISIRRNYSLEALKSRLSLSIQKTLIYAPHPTVWKEMQRQATDVSLLNQLFLQIPQVLHW